MHLPLLLLLFLLLPLVAGAWVRFRVEGTTRIKLLLAFSGAFLLSVTVLHMLPELYERGGHGIGTWLLAGFMFQVVLEYFSHGIEHGHVHVHLPGKGHGRSQAVPMATLFSLCLHSFTEGIPFADARVGGDIAFVAGVLLHKMPMAIALATVLRAAHSGALRSWVILTVFALAAPAGIAVGAWLGADIGEDFLVRALALAIGMLLHISTTIIFETTPEHRFDARRFLTIVAGVLLGLATAHLGH
ncbi:MAG TPA: ZIP family metal transporter [Flavobacteriales bacterium]